MWEIFNPINPRLYTYVCLVIHNSNIINYVMSVEANLYNLCYGIIMHTNNIYYSDHCMSCALN